MCTCYALIWIMAMILRRSALNDVQGSHPCLTVYQEYTGREGNQCSRKWVWSALDERHGRIGDVHESCRLPEFSSPAFIIDSGVWLH